MHTGLAVITGDRGPPARLRRADPRHRRQPRVRVHRVPETRRPGTRPAARARTRPLRPHSPPNGPASRPHPGAATPGTALAVLAAVLDRDGQQLSATQTREPGPLRRRPPGRPARDLDRRDHPRPRAALPRPAPGRPAARIPRASPATRPEVAVAHPARRRTGRPGPRPGPGRRDRRTGPGRRPRRPRRHRRPDPAPARHPGPAPARPVVRAGPRHRRPRTPRLRHRRSPR